LLDRDGKIKRLFHPALRVKVTGRKILYSRKSILDFINNNQIKYEKAKK